MMTGFVAPLRLRALAGDAARRVTWLELFFDLVFVAAVAQVAEPLHHHYTVSGVVRFATLFTLVWWAWTGYTVFATRFDADDVVQRGLTLVQMFVVAAMAANAGDELDSVSSAGFAAAYAVLRLVLVAQYFRARHLVQARPFTTRYIVGHGLAAMLWLASAFVPVPARYIVWAVAFAIDLGTPWLALPHSTTLPPDGAHLPERFGLFTLILLGEAVVAVMHGMESHEEWAPAAATSAFLGMGVLFVIWWWYFDGIRAAGDRHVRNHGDALRFHAWTYAHCPLYVGLVLTGVGVQRIITAASRAPVGGTDAAVLMTSAATVMVSMAVLAATSPGSGPLRRRIGAMGGIAAVTMTGGLVLLPASPLALIVMIAAGFSAQALVAHRSARPARPKPTVPILARQEV